MLEGLYKRKKTSRFDVLFYIVAAIFIVLALRLLTLQILAGGYYQAKAEGNRLRMVTMTAARGIMYDRNGQILVGSRPAYTISICLLYTSPSPRDTERSRMPSSA